MSTYSFFFNDTATTEIYTLSLHDALPISSGHPQRERLSADVAASIQGEVPSQPAELSGGRLESDDGSAGVDPSGDRKSTRLNSSHGYISYAVFCLKEKTTDHVGSCLQDIS